MAAQIGIMAVWMTIISFCFLKLPIFLDIFGSKEKLYTAYFVLFVVAALFNGFNVRDDGFGIFKNLNENTGFMKVWIAIVLVQALIVNAALIPLTPFKWISSMFSCTPFGVIGWVVVFVLAFTIIPVDLVRKGLMNKAR